ncbi:hypothetical protein ACRALDRAFT_205129 [Sodiomyces alcalophilus JCM 7366]|uniref:uncharacterized protein n=1 Tax=Sodiomyces alcalophilus JCM 7366 TaxID=591952 RepID=UPI0039B4BF40
MIVDVLGFIKGLPVDHWPLEEIIPMGGISIQDDAWELSRHHHLHAETLDKVFQQDLVSMDGTVNGVDHDADQPLSILATYQSQLRMDKPRYQILTAGLPPPGAIATSGNLTPPFRH